jgi:hypothetical protein
MKELIRSDILSLQADSRFCRAVEALKKRGEEAVSRASGRRKEVLEIAAGLVEMLPFFATLAVKGKSTSGAEKKLWSIGTGKTWKALRALPDRLRGIAKEIQMINESPFFSPERVITSKEPIAVYSKGHFLRLPIHLQRYSDWMEAWTGAFPRLYRAHFPRAQRGHSPSVGYVSVLAQVITGRFCDNEVAELLNAADRVLNPDNSDREDGFHPQTLADFRSRRKKKEVRPIA